ncbi:MAG: DNA repair protein RadC [Defluviitaleaceae bacterium]|nr:DNA repair protein RadC [Defluviitaleaceae bacterium]
MKDNKPKKENPHDKHRIRMRARYRTGGLDGFADHEVLEMLLYYTQPRGNTNPRAHEMLNQFGSLHNLFEADVEALMERLGCTENVAVLINMVPALANRYFRSKISQKLRLDSERAAGEYAMDLFLGHSVERFYVFCLDSQLRLKNTTLISEGTVNEAAVYPREVARAAFQDKVTNVILAHNHPGGSLRPSIADSDVTRMITAGLSFFDIKVLDHIIVAGDTYFSFAARKLHVAGYL